MCKECKFTCTHCGTPERALTVWPLTTHQTCPCLCHNAYLYDRERLLAAKSRKKKK